MDNTKTWFSEWFNTTYYHILYKNRNNEEAQRFIKNLVSFLKLPKENTILDLACGKGRHSIFLNSLGYNVIGADLSKNSIDYANKFGNSKLKFIVQDMRKPFNIKVNAVFNMFTSFGYFDDDNDDIQVLKNIETMIETDGVAVVDYMNVNKVIKNLVKSETIARDHLNFNIKRHLTNGFITKDIDLTDKGEEFHFQERVKAIDLDKFTSYCEHANLKINHIFGDYNLSEFNSDTSDRLILILSK
ncbi:cyclopropane fatty-acyl-phospholipid synthase-like methyltransferase [Wenyingzhuangia heitensis]|uniref:Cyclopropane fatty-acyl-phospholipid synthase-like methyltransferase n=1 Tax=Wenyingzhuangia heitensis TaxID=1487859 RepID=A0ABX0UBY2_9FLAO|nr:class I SAM-dependent methyltransferase [Wenyingzhuangia heitensis]NIJ44981.1 cyclopropane fatty-acyl-phospholipid synthase-like methyltransferase [Wenyingzhuangia heitensis]